MAPSAEVGGIINGLVGIMPVMLSPVFFTMEQAPLLLRWFGWVSPFRYAADGIMKSLSGRTDIRTEFTVLAGFAAMAMAIGFWRMRWRER
jgi:ABC-type multidrug transport system permease subunit